MGVEKLNLSRTQRMHDCPFDGCIGVGIKNINVFYLNLLYMDYLGCDFPFGYLKRLAG
jgi:hypothetical protein